MSVIGFSIFDSINTTFVVVLTTAVRINQGACLCRHSLIITQNGFTTGFSSRRGGVQIIAKITLKMNQHRYPTRTIMVMIYSFYTGLFNQCTCSSGRRVLLNDTIYPFDKDVPISRPLQRDRRKTTPSNIPPPQKNNPLNATGSTACSIRSFGIHLKTVSSFAKVDKFP